MRPRLVALLAGFTSVGLACGHDYSSAPDAPVDAGVEAAVEAGPIVEAGSDADAGGCPVLYVSTGGSDLNTGCDQTKPKATIAGAIGYVKTLGLTNQEIHVCAGTYNENGLTLDYPVTLRGGYECSLWERHQPFAWSGLDPTTGRANFDLTNETIIDAGSATVALTVSGATVTSATSIEGFTLRGSATAGGPGLLLDDGTAARIVNDEVLGAAAGPSSDGIVIKDTVTSEVTNCVIQGGNGGTADGTDIGSAGVTVNTTGVGPTIHDNEIDSGNGTSLLQVASIGVQLKIATQLIGAQALRNNAIFFQASTAANGPVSYGIAIASGAAADIVGNGIYGGTIGCTTATCTASAIYATGASPTATTIVGNRLGAGSVTASAHPPNLYPVFVNGGSNVVISNNLIAFQAGNISDGDGIAVTATSSNVSVTHNTILAPLGLTVATGIVTTGEGVTVDNNLIVGTRIGYISVQAQCTGSGTISYPPTSLANNAFVGVEDVAALDAVDTGTCEGVTAATTIGDLVAMLPIAAHDILLSSTCASGDTTCFACTTASCLEVFTDTPSLATLVQGDARLTANVTCAIAKGGDSNVMLTPTDLAGAARTNPTTIGALEDNGACTP